MKAKPMVSVIIPAYNHERYIGATIESVIQQTLDDFELIIIDDGSTDKTYHVIQCYKDKRIAAYTQRNMDAANTLNRGLDMAKGAFIAILNSDDLYAPTRLEKLHAAITRNDTVCVFSDIQPINSAGKPITSDQHYWNKAHEENKKVWFDTGDMLTTLLHANLMATTSNLFMTLDAARQIGPFGTFRYLHDYDYILRFAQLHENKVMFFNEKLLSYRIHPENTIKKGEVEAREQDLGIIRQNILLRVSQDDRQRVKVGLGHVVRMEQELRWVKLLHRFPLLRLAARFGSMIKAWII